MSEPVLTPLGTYELFAEIGFCKYFHLGGAEATRELIQAYGIFEKAYVLDVGCASGKTACTLARLYGCRVVGVDLLPKMVERARQRARDERVEGLVDFRVGDAQALPLEAGQFDFVIGEFITGLLDNKEKAVQEYVRVVKPGGAIGLNEATLIKSPPPGLPRHLAKTVGLRGELLTAGGWRDLLESLGLKDLVFRIHKAEPLSNPRDDILDTLQTLPKFVHAILNRPMARKMLREVLAVPKDLTEYFGYGIYVGRT